MRSRPRGDAHPMIRENLLRLFAHRPISKQVQSVPSREASQKIPGTNALATVQRPGDFLIQNKNPKLSIR